MRERWATSASTSWPSHSAHRSWHRRGSLAPGKIADLVILSGNPLKVDKLAIKDIKVLETFKEGQSIYKRP